MILCLPTTSDITQFLGKGFLLDTSILKYIHVFLDFWKLKWNEIQSKYNIKI